MDQKKLKSLRTRIIKADHSFGAMGSMLLALELDHTELVDIILLQDFMVNHKNSHSSELVSDAIIRKQSA